MMHGILPETWMPYLRYFALGAPVAALILSRLLFPRNKGVQILLSAAATVFAIRTVIGPHADQMKDQLISVNGFLGR